MFELPLLKLFQRSHDSVVFDQCRYGQVSAKPIELLYHGARFETLQRQCNHAAGHKSVVQQRDSKGVYRPKQLAA